MFLKLSSCLFGCFIVKAPFLHSSPAAPAQCVSNTKMSRAHHSFLSSDGGSHSSFGYGCMDLKVTLSQILGTGTGLCSDNESGGETD